MAVSNLRVGANKTSKLTSGFTAGYIVIGGGGAGGAQFGGGGGAGGYLTGTFVLPRGILIPVVVGRGGRGGIERYQVVAGTNGGNSSILWHYGNWWR